MAIRADHTVIIELAPAVYEIPAPGESTQPRPWSNHMNIAALVAISPDTLR